MGGRRPNAVPSLGTAGFGNTGNVLFPEFMFLDEEDIGRDMTKSGDDALSPSNINSGNTNRALPELPQALMRIRTGGGVSAFDEAVTKGRSNRVGGRSRGNRGGLGRGQ